MAQRDCPGGALKRAGTDETAMTLEHGLRRSSSALRFTTRSQASSRHGPCRNRRARSVPTASDSAE